MSFRSTEVVACINHLFFFIAEQYSIVGMHHSLFNHSPTEGHFGCFQFLTMTKKSSYEQSCAVVSVDISFFFSSGIAQSYSKCMYVQFFKKLPTIFQNICTILHSHKKCMRDTVSLHPTQRLVFSHCFLPSVLIGVW